MEVHFIRNRRSGNSDRRPFGSQRDGWVTSQIIRTVPEQASKALVQHDAVSPQRHYANACLDSYLSVLNMPRLKQVT